MLVADKISKLEGRYMGLLQLKALRLKYGLIVLETNDTPSKGKARCYFPYRALSSCASAVLTI